MTLCLENDPDGLSGVKDEASPPPPKRGFGKVARQREVRMSPPSKGERHREVDERRHVMPRQNPLGGGVRCCGRQLSSEGDSGEDLARER